MSRIKIIPYFTLLLTTLSLLMIITSIQWIWQKQFLDNNNDYYLRLLSLGDFEPCQLLSNQNNNTENVGSFEYICSNFNSKNKEDIYHIYSIGFYNLASIAIDNIKSSSQDYQILLSAPEVHPYLDTKNIIEKFPLDKDIINSILSINPDNKVLLKRIEFLSKEIPG